MRIVLCRHGETDFNVQKRLQGKMETELNEHGFLQAKLIAENLKNEKFYTIFCSPRKRCLQTAEEINKFHNKKIEVREELSEIDLGIFTGMNREEIEHNFPGEWSKRVDNKYEFLHKNGESYEEVDKNRVAKFIQELKEKYSARNILIITHAGLGRLLIGSLLGLSGQEKMRIEFPNECIYFIDYKPHKTKISYLCVESKLSGEGFLKN
ncbi:MAG: histidine phosphatase family protein [Candidatus Diapherotrites archaeon]